MGKDKYHILLLEDMKLIVDISDELHSKLKHKAIDQKTTLRDLVNQALEKLVK